MIITEFETSDPPGFSNAAFAEADKSTVKSFAPAEVSALSSFLQASRIEITDPVTAAPAMNFTKSFRSISDYL